MTPADATGLLEVLSRAERGPRRDGGFALWLTVRVVADIAIHPEWPERAHRRRLQGLEHRLTSLSLSPSLRRAIAGSLAQLRDLRPDTALMALAQLVAPVRESLGSEAAEAVRRVVADLRGR